MKKIRSFFSNIATLTLLSILGVGLIMFLNSHSQNSLTSQAPETKPTITQNDKKPTANSTQEQKATSTPTVETTVPNENEPEDDRPEPTWTPVIVLPDSTSPPDPTALPTPTATSVNPNENILMSFDVPASLGEISPDGKTLAFNRWEVETKGNPYDQIWLMDLDTKQTTKLVEAGRVGANQVWSPDGQKIAYQVSNYEEMEIKIIDVNGQNDRSLLKSEDLFGYYWINSEQIGLIQSNGIDRVDLSGRIVEKQSTNLRTAPSGIRPQVAGSPENHIVIIEDGALRIISSSDDENMIRADEGEKIVEFAISPNGQFIAYTTTQGTGIAFWVSNLTGGNPRKLLEQVKENRGNISNLVWSPDSQAVVLVLSEFGTSSNLSLVWVDTNSGKIVPLQVDSLTRNIVFNPNGKLLYYTRMSDAVDDPPWGKGTFYQLRLK